MQDPEDNLKYLQKDYWNERFKSENEYEWLAQYKDFKDQLINQIQSLNINKQDIRILELGCGNSGLSNELLHDGFQNLSASDYSEVVIENMKLKFPQIQWFVSDVTDLKEFQDDSFDLVIEKGVMDALIVDEGSVWDPEQEVKDRVHSMLSSVKRVMSKKNSLFVQISFQQPHFRKKYTQDGYDWSYKYENVNSGLGYFMYIYHLQQQ